VIRFLPRKDAESRGKSQGGGGGYVATTNDTNTNRWRFECLVSRIALALIFELLRARYCLRRLNCWGRGWDIGFAAS
jgi:hypothetical protein